MKQQHNTKTKQNKLKLHVQCDIENERRHIVGTGS